MTHMSLVIVGTSLILIGVWNNRTHNHFGEGG